MVSEILFFIIIICFWLVRRKRENTLSGFLNEPLYLCWALMSISIFDYTPSIFQYAVRAGAMVLSVIVICQSQHTLLLLKRGAMGILVVYLALCFISTIWSVDMIQTFVKACELLVDMALICAIINYEKFRENVFYKLMYILFGMCLLVEIYVAVGAIALHSTFITVNKGVFGIQLNGGIISSNSLGGITVFSTICLLNFKEFKYRVPFLMLTIAELILCQARTSLASFFIVIVIFAFRTRKKVLYFVSLILVVAVAYFNYDLIMAYFIRGTDATNLQTMSGRVTMWAGAIEKIKERPWLGYGFGSGGEMVSKLNNGMSSLHSGIYESLMGVGIVGFAILLLVYVYILIRLIRNILKYGIRDNSMEIMLISDLTIRTYMSVGMGGWHSHVLMIFFVLATMLSLHRTGTLTMLWRGDNTSVPE